MINPRGTSLVKMNPSVSSMLGDNPPQNQSKASVSSFSGSSPAQHGTMSSKYMVFALINQMIGETALALPVLFNQEGWFSCILVLLLQGFISFKTSGILVNNLKQSEKDVSESIQRILGTNWWKFFQLLSSIYLYLVSLQYFLAITNVIYRILTYFMQLSGIHSFAKPSELDYSVFSLQYVALIVIIPIAVLTFINKIELLVSISQQSIYAIGAYALFILFNFFANLASGRVSQHFSDVSLFSFGFGNVTGTAAIGFSIHTTIGPVIKQNANQQNNLRDLRYAFASSSILYIFVGLFGGIGIIGRKLQTESAENITDFFSETDPSSLIIMTIYLVNIGCCLPLYFNISRTRFFEFFYADSDVPAELLAIFNIVFAFFCVGLSNMPFIKSSDLMNANGAITCFFTMYLIPIFLHFQAYHGQNSLMLKLKKSISRIGLIDDSHIALESTLLKGVNMEKDDQYNLFVNYEEDEDSEADDSSSSADDDILHSKQTSSEMKRTLREKKEFEKQKHMLLENKSKKFSIILYGIIGLAGLSSLIYSIVELSRKFLSSEPDQIFDN